MNDSQYLLATLEKLKKKLSREEKSVKNIQTITDLFSIINPMEVISSEREKILLDFLRSYNISLDEPYLATGQSGYYNERIEQNGLADTSLDEETIEDCNYILNFFGKRQMPVSKSKVPKICTTLLGSTEFNYATQSFPAFIYEQLFMDGILYHNLPINLIVGESEQDYFMRVMQTNIEKYKKAGKVLNGTEEECLRRTKRIIDKFCRGKNRIYLIKMSEVLDYYISFGDLRGGVTEEKVKEIETLREAIYDRSTPELYHDENFACEHGIFIYGDLSHCPIRYIEVDRKYDVLQKMAIDLGYPIGAEFTEKDIISNSHMDPQLEELCEELREECYRYGHADIEKLLKGIRKILSDRQLKQYYEQFGKHTK